MGGKGPLKTCRIPVRARPKAPDGAGSSRPPRGVTSVPAGGFSRPRNEKVPFPRGAHLPSRRRPPRSRNEKVPFGSFQKRKLVVEWVR